MINWVREEKLILDHDAVAVHVYPLFGREHNTENGLDCWCHPFCDEQCPNVVIHNVQH